MHPHTKKYGYLRSQNADYIEELYARYLENPTSVDESWQYFFDGLELSHDMPRAENAASANGTNGIAKAEKATNLVALPVPSETLSSEAKVMDLIQAYRRAGILAAHINPLEASPAKVAALELSQFGLSDQDLDRKFTASKLIGFSAPATLREILQLLKDTYCSTIGVEFTHIQNQEQYSWLAKTMEGARNRPSFSKEVKTKILQKLTDAECFERFLHTRFVAQKRFSVEGADAMIPMLDLLAIQAAEDGASDVVIGMAHRGRLNVLTNIFGKKPENIFAEFEGNVAQDMSLGEGDVKYHMGYSADIKTPSGKSIHLSLASNPSHLEFVNPVVEGIARAKQDLKKDSKARDQVIPVQIHGDAAFAGQGIVYETLQLSQLRGYATGGTIHIVANNQVGFTTSPIDSRSTPYSTDLAKMLESPVFHVNGDDAEACAYTVQLALQFRQKYHQDVVIDLVCYRKYGHNEGDEPSFTQPLMYKKIKDHPSPREIYAKKLEANGVLSSGEIQAQVTQMNEKLEQSLKIAKAAALPPSISVFEGTWKGLRRATEEDLLSGTTTKVDVGVLKEIGRKLGTVPQDFTVHSKLQRLLEQRASQVEKGTGIDWGTGEALAFATLLWQGIPVRVSGQDCERGTFSHRHSVLNDFNNGKAYAPLNHFKDGQAEYTAINSSLSEAAVLGFEYGYGLANPKALVIWEAQFGDFANGAQVIIDQFISSSESKWQRMNGLVMLLPHGYEGQGPEHSSARLERFLQLCGRHNMIVGNFTTPAQIFHALRRQVIREFRKPLVVMSPKSLLRHPKAVSNLHDFSNGSFQEVIADPEFKAAKARKIVLCSGKLFYELEAARTAQGKSDVAIVRIEQLYPWPVVQLSQVLDKLLNGSPEIVWAQEEPKNMGAWTFVRSMIEEMSSDFTSLKKAMEKIRYVGRGMAAAPAVGSSKIHEKEQKIIIEEALR